MYKPLPSYKFSLLNVPLSPRSRIKTLMSLNAGTPPESESDPAPTRGSGKRTRPAQPDTRTFRGVRRRSWGRYVSEIRLPGQKTRVWLGSFTTPEMAARAYDSAAFFLKGTSAVLNYPDSINSLPRPESCSTRDIQVAASRAAQSNNTATLTKPESEIPGSPDWLNLGELCYDTWTASFEEIMDGPLFSPLRLDDEIFAASCI